MVVEDKIEREIVINAPLDRVWALVSEPGWWIGDGDRSGQRRWKEGDLDIIEDPRYGRFPLRTVGLEPSRYISFRWIMDPSKESESEKPTTLVEFWVEARDSTTVVRVVESGFTKLPNAEDAIAGNTEGWRFQMDRLKTDAESAAA